MQLVQWHTSLFDLTFNSFFANFITTIKISIYSSKMPIKSIKARQIFDSRGNPTVEVDLTTDLGLFRAAVPSGASTGIHEALELRDKEPNNWMGKGVLKAVAHVNDSLGPEVIKSGLDETKQREVIKNISFIIVTQCYNDNSSFRLMN